MVIEMLTKSSAPYINEFFFLFLAGIPRAFNSIPFAFAFFIGESSISEPTL